VSWSLAIKVSIESLKYVALLYLMYLMRFGESGK